MQPSNNTTTIAHRQLKRRQRQLKKRLLIVLAIIAGLLIWLWPRYFDGQQAIVKSDSSSSNSSSHTTSDSATSKATGGTVVQELPPFTVLTPDGKSVDSLGGSVLTPPDSDSKTYVYIDTINGVQLRVSQQELPTNFRNDTQSHMDELAAGYSMNRTITDKNSTDIYIGTSTKGTQSVMFTKNNLLVMILSSAVLNDEQWTTYINSLS